LLQITSIKSSSGAIGLYLWAITLSLKRLDKLSTAYKEPSLTLNFVSFRYIFGGLFPTLGPVGRGVSSE